MSVVAFIFGFFIITGGSRAPEKTECVAASIDCEPLSGLSSLLQTDLHVEADSEDNEIPSVPVSEAKDSQRETVDGEVAPKSNQGWVVNRTVGKRAYFDVHIPKTGGVSLILDIPLVLPEGEGYWTKERCLMANLSLKMAENDDGDIALFRDPIGHVYSQYLECKYDNAWGRPLTIANGGLPYMENVTTWLAHFDGGEEKDDFKCYHPYNMQTRALTCTDEKCRHYTEELSLDEALLNLKSLQFAGITEHYQASLCLFHARTHNLQAPLPAFCNCSDEEAWNSFPTHHFTHNVPPHSNDDLTEEDISMIEELTQMDAVVYSTAYDNFIRDVSEVERHFNVKLLC